ncbi:MAG: hypothetical protein AB7E05_00900 [Sphingobium sp.]
MKGRSRSACFIPVNAFQPYEGVGRALASAYSARDQADLPDDMKMLLDRIDCAVHKGRMPE